MDILYHFLEMDNPVLQYGVVLEHYFILFVTNPLSSECGTYKTVRPDSGLGFQVKVH